ncbi:MAG: AMP phosphorylase [Candidatus Woesearchaeota archaeon]
MILKTKCLNIRTGGPLICVINEKDAEAMNIYNGDRVILKHRDKEVVAIVDVSSEIIKSGTIGLFYETFKKLEVQNNKKLFVLIAQKPDSINYIREKIDGKELSYDKIKSIIQDITDNKLSETEITYFISACYPNKLSRREIIYLAKSMVETGDSISFNSKHVMDVHCIGGVPGNRTTMLIVPIIAAYGLKIPKTSSRAITSPAGTADTMEVLSEVSFTIERIKKIVEETNGCIVWGGSVALAPADDKIIKIEKLLSIDSEGQMIASILAKKKSVSANNVLLDIPVGAGSKATNLKQAYHLKKNFEFTAKNLGINLKVIFSNGSEPIGNGIGPALEARDVLWCLEKDERAPKDLILKSLKMSALMIMMVKRINFSYAFSIAKKILDSGAAHNKMLEIIEAQKPKIKESSRIKLGNFSSEVGAKKSGKIVRIDNILISRIARAAGAPSDSKAGIYLHKHVNNYVRETEPLYTIYAENKQKLEFALSIAEQNPVFFIK